jgi:hypothetical protein
VVVGRDDGGEKVMLIAGTGHGDYYPGFSCAAIDISRYLVHTDSLWTSPLIRKSLIRHKEARD